MAPRKSSSSLSPIPIGNCEVLIEANKYSCNSDPNGLQICISKNTKIKISVKDETNERSGNELLPSKSEGKGEEVRCSDVRNQYMFVLLNPKDVDGATKSYLQEVLKLYNEELPAMNYAANTGKQSMFLDRCVSNGKYCTLLLKHKSVEGFEEIIGAITYQIVPADTHFAEIPLAAVNAIFQHKGFGHILHMELKKRLQSVGIRTILCWGDKESEGFWLKQGFVSMAEVNKKGRARRLPIKADIRKALCFPGGSTLMVSHLSKDASAIEDLSCSIPLKLCEKSQSSVAEKSLEPKGGNVAAKQCSRSSQGAKRKVWEASLSSLMTKKVKGTHHIDSHQNDFQLDSNWHMIPDGSRNGSRLNGCSISTDKSLVDVTPGVFLINNCITNEVPQEGRPNSMTPEAPPIKEHQSNRECFRIMLMNIADDTKKTQLTKVIENLGGAPSFDGSISTHIITGKVRKTLNFCTALCSGAWIVSSSWLKESFKEGKFVDELPHILHDEDYVLKYGTELKDSVLRAKARPGALLAGYDLCIAAHVQAPVTTLSAIIKSAGGNIIDGLDEVNEASKTIFIVCEDDMEEALAAVKKGVWTFSSDWLMNCVMQQELDLGAPPFAMSL